MVAARLMEALGPEAVVSHARTLGITAPLTQDLSLALGSGSVTPIELTNAYATWAAGGTYQDWALITEVRDPSGRVLPLPPRPAPRQAMGPAEAWLVTSAMTTVIERGTARAARALGRPIAGKTGTTDRARDAWFVGYTPELVTGVWVGFDDRQSLGASEEGARAALPLWTHFVRAYLRDRHPPALEFARPQGITAVAIDPATGLPPALGAVMAPGAVATTLEEYFLSGTEPQPPAAPVDAGVAPAADDAAAYASEVADAGPESLVAPSVDAGDDDDVPPPSTVAPDDPGLVLPLQ
jgi:penicillin-binding protein 1A